MAGFLDGQGHWREAIQWLETVQNAGEASADQLAQALVQTKLGLFHLRLAEREQAEHHLQQVETLLAAVAESAATVVCKAYAYEAQAQLRLAQGLAEQASACVDRGIAAFSPFKLMRKVKPAWRR